MPWRDATRRTALTGCSFGAHSHPEVVWHEYNRVHKWRRAAPEADAPELLETAAAARRQRGEYIEPEDDDLMLQWHLENTGDVRNGVAGEDVNAKEAWRAGYTGTGILVNVVDDGVDDSNPSIAGNYDAASSFSYAYEDGVVVIHRNAPHGTRVAGVIAGTADDECGVGVAFDAKVAAVQWADDSTFTATVVSEVLTHNYQNAHISSNSWGPFPFEKSGRVVWEAVDRAMIEGRNGLGTIIVAASGNDGQYQGDCNDDYLQQTRYSISVGAFDAAGRLASYSEGCPALFIAGASGGSGPGLTTTDLAGSAGYSGDCAFGFSGTSAATPVVSGGLALVLEANPTLSWRDVQHIVQQTARHVAPSHSSWTTNAAGIKRSDRLGFGALDVGAAVAAAVTWEPVLDADMFEYQATPFAQPIPDNDLAGLDVFFDVDSEVKLEHVRLDVKLDHPSISQLGIVLTSPYGTESRLQTADTLNIDGSTTYEDHFWTTVNSWGETSKGVWRLRITDEKARFEGDFLSATLTVWGTDDADVPVADGIFSLPSPIPPSSDVDYDDDAEEEEEEEEGDGDGSKAESAASPALAALTAAAAVCAAIVL